MGKPMLIPARGRAQEILTTQIEVLNELDWITKDEGWGNYVPVYENLNETDVDRIEAGADPVKTLMERAAEDFPDVVGALTWRFY